MAKTQQGDGQAEGAGGKPLQLDEVIAGFISACQYYEKTFFKTVAPEQIKVTMGNLLEAWNGFLAGQQGGQHTDAIVSSDIQNDIQEFIASPLNTSGDGEEWMGAWLADWNDFLWARQGKSPVTKCDVFWTALGVLLYVADMVSDVYTAVQFGYTGHWWECALTLCVVYLAVAISRIYKLLLGHVLWTGPLDRLRYLVSLLVSWPDLQQCWTLLRVEWKLTRIPRSNAHLVPVWQENRLRVAEIKLMEGVCEACPQALLQLVLLLPDLDGDITRTVCMRMVGPAISLCAAGAALVNREKIVRFAEHTALPLRELVVLYVWAVPGTVSRLLCLALLLSMHLYGGLACIVLHLALYVRRSRAVRHAIHFLGNTSVTVVWALDTSLHCTQPVLYAALISSISVTFIIGVLGCRLHWKYWPLHH